MRRRSAPIVRFLNVSGSVVRDRHGDTGDPIYASKDALLEVRPESEKLTERQQERHRELIDRFEKDPRFHRLPDREAGTGEDETPKKDRDEGAPATMGAQAHETPGGFVGELERRRRERIVLSSG